MCIHSLHSCMQVDNTVRENKNRTVLLYIGWLIGRLNLNVVSLCFLRKGHTHNRMGAQSLESYPILVPKPTHCYRCQPKVESNVCELWAHRPMLLLSPVIPPHLRLQANGVSTINSRMLSFERKPKGRLVPQIVMSITSPPLPLPGDMLHVESECYACHGNVFAHV
jgi:hypothetical protein